MTIIGLLVVAALYFIIYVAIYLFPTMERKETENDTRDVTDKIYDDSPFEKYFKR